MRASLASSLSYLHSALAERLSLSAADADAAATRIRTHRVRPGVFGRYYKLVFAVESGQLEKARALFLEILEQAQDTPTLSIAPFTDAALGEEKRLYNELIDPDAATRPWMAAPQSSDGLADRVVRALALIEAADPRLAGEVRALIVEIVGAAPSHAPGARPFGSVSSLMLWGLVIVNLERYATAETMVEGLVHEAAHLLLFAHSVDGPLVANAIEERYTSPLRSDPRPMDGVFHATFVSARMYYVTRKLREAAAVDTARLDERLKLFRELYFGGLQTVQAHAKLTPTGKRIIAESVDYMSEA